MAALVGSEPSRDDVTLLMIRFGALPPVPKEADTDADAAFPVEMVNGVPVVLAPEEMDITNVDGLRMALLNSAAFGKATLVAT